MFFNLAWRNSKRSRNENLIYFLTMVTAVTAFYIVLSLGAQDVIRFLSSLESDAVERLLTNLLPTVYVCALLFVFFLVVFANKYQLECRSRELGLYLMFGMTKTRLFTQIMTEGLITSLVALLGGLICGGFLSEVISLATARLVGHGIIAHQSSFSLSAVFFTILGFLIIQCVALFILCGKLFKKEVHQLLYGEMAKKQHTGSTHGSLLSLVIGTAVLLVAYWVAIEHFMAGGGVMLLVAVLLGIVGTILFIRGIARLLSIVAASNKRKATNGLYVFTLRQLHENVVYKYISISVASILMMLTIMFIANGSATIMSHGNELTRTSAVYDFTVMGEEQNIEQYLSDEQMRVYVANLNRMETGNMKRPASGEMKSFVDWSVLRKEIVQNLPEGVIDPATQEAASYELGSHQPAALNLLGFIDTGSVAPYMLPVSSYNRLLEAAGEKQINLENDEAVFYLNPDFLGKAQEDTIALLDRIAENAQTSGNALISIDKKSVTLVPSVPMKGLTADENVKIVTALIVSDEIYHNYVDPDTCSVYWNFCIPNELVEANGLMLSVMEARDLLKPSGLYYECNTIATEQSAVEVENHEPFWAKWSIFCRLKVRSYVLAANVAGTLKVAPLQILKFPVVLPHKFLDAEKFNLRFSDASEITEIADKLRWYRYQKGLRQRDAADYAGIDRSTYIHYEEAGRDFYPKEHMEKLAELFEVPLEDLLDDYNLFLLRGQGAQIKAIRQRLGLTQKAYAAQLGVPLQKFKRWEQGTVQIFKSTWEKYFKQT